MGDIKVITPITEDRFNVSDKISGPLLTVICEVNLSSYSLNYLFDKLYT